MQQRRSACSRDNCAPAALAQAAAARPTPQLHHPALLRTLNARSCLSIQAVCTPVKVRGPPGEAPSLLGVPLPPPIPLPVRASAPGEPPPPARPPPSAMREGPAARGVRPGVVASMDPGASVRPMVRGWRGVEGSGAAVPPPPWPPSLLPGRASAAASRCMRLGCWADGVLACPAPACAAVAALRAGVPSPAVARPRFSPCACSCCSAAAAAAAAGRCLVAGAADAAGATRCGLPRAPSPAVPPALTAAAATTSLASAAPPFRRNTTRSRRRPSLLAIACSSSCLLAPGPSCQGPLLPCASATPTQSGPPATSTVCTWEGVGRWSARAHFCLPIHVLASSARPAAHLHLLLSVAQHNYRLLSSTIVELAQVDPWQLSWEKAIAIMNKQATRARPGGSERCAATVASRLPVQTVAATPLRFLALPRTPRRPSRGGW